MNQLHKKRILIVSHGHPDINKGGAEVASYNMFNELKRRNEDVYFLARTDLTPHGGAAFSQRKDHREILFHTTMDDGFLFSNIKTRHMWQEFRDLILLLKPDIVHLHHYFLLGVEMLEEIRRTLPQARIVLTLHEYLAICHNKGLMVKTNGKLCYKASARDCHQCFPDKQPGDFFLRQKYLQRVFENVDQFVSPSKFLKERYVDWGIAGEKINVIENGQLQPEGELETHLTQEIEIDKKFRFAFFGQINPYKGVDLLIQAVKLLPKKLRKRIVVEIHGANLDHQIDSYRDKVRKLLSENSAQVHFHGAYEANEMPKILSKVDWVVVPSIWWENSPMVIQEAFTQKVPLIVSDIGGMAEKVRDKVDGLHFRTGSAIDLASVLEKCIVDQSIRGKCANNILPPLTISDCVDKHIKLYTDANASN